MPDLRIDQQAAAHVRSFIIRVVDQPERVFGVDLVFDEGDNFRAYVDEYTHPTRGSRPRLYIHDTVIFTRSKSFDLTKQGDPDYLNSLALDVVSTYMFDVDTPGWVPCTYEEALVAMDRGEVCRKSSGAAPTSWCPYRKSNGVMEYLDDGEWVSSGLSVEHQQGCNWIREVVVAKACSGTVTYNNWDHDVFLVDSGPNRIDCMKLVRSVTGVGLPESKIVVENPPWRLRGAIALVEARAIQDQFSVIGARVEIRLTGDGVLV